MACEIATSIANLPPSYRQVLVMRAVEEVTAPEGQPFLISVWMLSRVGYIAPRILVRTSLLHWVE